MIVSSIKALVRFSEVIKEGATVIIASIGVFAFCCIVGLILIGLCYLLADYIPRKQEMKKCRKTWERIISEKEKEEK
jgi:hypothetical protein